MATAKMAYSKRSTGTAPNVYQVITDRIVKQLESGVAPWQKPWKGEDQLPRNFVTGKPYRGVNIWLLFCEFHTSPYWLTYKQATELGGNVKKGEKGTPIVFWKFGKYEKEEGGTTVEKKSFLVRYYTVFNLDQCENLKKMPEVVETVPVEPIAACEAVVTNWTTKPEVKHGGNKAAYHKILDYILMPERNSFNSPEEYYSTLFHEFTHSTGHEKRLNRESLTDAKMFGDEGDSREELVAEMGAAFLSGMTGIENKTINNSASYLQHWVKTLKEDPRMILVAGAQAQKAADFILNRKFETESETGEN